MDSDGTATGTTIKFNPVTGTDTFVQDNGVTTNILIKHHCITLMREYESKSLEELRFEDYLKAHRKKSGGTLTYGLPVRPPLYGGFGARSAATGTTVKFNPVTGTEILVENRVKTNIQLKYQCITCMPEYESESLEELRCEDYLENRKGPISAQLREYFGTGSVATGTTNKFNPLTGQKTFVKNDTTTNIQLEHQCIMRMREYEFKSLEEQRFEDYLANRKGPSAQVGGYFDVGSAATGRKIKFMRDYLKNRK